MSRRPSTPRLPDARSAAARRHRDAEHVAHAANERRVDVLLFVGREDDDAAVFFEQLQLTGVRIGVAVGESFTSVRLLNRASASSNRSTAFMRAARVDLPEVLCRLADVLADHRSEIDAKEIQLQSRRDDLCSHGLAGSRRAAEQCYQAGAAREQALGTGRFPKRHAVPRLKGKVLQRLAQSLRHHQVVPGKRAVE